MLLVERQQAPEGVITMSKSIARGLFYGVATILILWTGSLTYAFVATALPQAHWLVPLFALVVFDVGMLAWLKVFLDYAEGSGQRAVALMMCVFDFLGVGLMVLAEILLGGQDLVSAPPSLGEYAIWGIAIWTVVNVGAVIAFHLLDPDARRKMALRTEMDMVFDEALQKLSTKRVNVSGQLSDQMSDRMLAQLMAELATDPKHPAMSKALQPNQSAAAAAGNHQGREDFLG
jgi:hypothetical protein